MKLVLLSLALACALSVAPAQGPYPWWMDRGVTVIKPGESFDNGWIQIVNQDVQMFGQGGAFNQLIDWPSTGNAYIRFSGFKMPLDVPKSVWVYEACRGSNPQFQSWPDHDIHLGDGFSGSVKGLASPQDEVWTGDNVHAFVEGGGGVVHALGWGQFDCTASIGCWDYPSMEVWSSSGSVTAVHGPVTVWP